MLNGFYMDVITLDNIIYSLQRAGGISVYWTELLSRMIRDDYNLYFHENTNVGNNIFRKKLSIPSDNITHNNIIPLFIQRYLPLITQVKFGIFHSSYYRIPIFYKGKTIITVFDFTYEKYRKGLPRFIHSMQKYNALKYADGVICISDSTKKDLLEIMPSFPENKLSVIHLGVSSDFSCNFQNIPIQFLNSIQIIKKPYLVFVGDRKGYKKFDIVVQAMLYLKNYHLVIIGGGDLDVELQHLNSCCKNRFTHFKKLSNNELNYIYHFAHALIYPSIYEGFGLPILEAMASGCPVIASNISSIPEVAGNAGMLMNETNSKNIVSSILNLENEHVRSKQIKLGLENAKKFDWEDTYKKTISFYKFIYHN
jgi:mannosyltransferase